jgi:two-component system, OmpR family, alkaline phosphatase synthesis response regulator PhoP
MKTILIIEDDLNVRESLVDLLDVEGFKTIAAENGRIGLTLAHDIHPDLVLCDVMMPEVDGFKVLQSLRENPETGAIPFIFLSARTTKLDMRRGMELGADDYLFKPFTSEELLSAISARLNKQAALIQQLSTPIAPPIRSSTGSEDGLLNYFYQELRNPLSNLSLVLHWLRQCSPEELDHLVEPQEYSREISVLQQVNELRDHLTPECAQLILSCHLDRIAERELIRLFA